VYNARMAPFKRHHLARDVKRLLIIGGTTAEGDTQAYFQEVRRALPQADFTHAVNNAWLPPAKLALALNGSRVGLCLSAVEGAMYAAVEYLLCGLPVVSTASRGGRDEWFDPDFTRIVRDDPAAVADAVNELAAMNVSPQHVRQRTLRRLWPHRRRFVARIQDVYDSEQVGRDFAREWYSRFFHKMGYWRDPRQVMHYLAKDCG
jgi:glycosyltransferase involved in cell wall biosynthesis